MRGTYRALGDFEHRQRSGPSKSRTLRATLSARSAHVGNQKNDPNNQTTQTLILFRAMAACWEIQVLYRKEQSLVKGAHIRIVEEGATNEFSQMIPNLEIGRNLLNRQSRGKGGNARIIAGELTIRRLPIVGKH